MSRVPQSLQQAFKIALQDGHGLLHHGVRQGHEALRQNGHILLVLQLLESRIDLIDKFFLGVHHSIPSGIGNIQLLGKVVLKLLAHILQKLQMERALLHARRIDALHQLGQLSPFKKEQKPLVSLHLQRHNNLQGLHFQFHFATVAKFGIFHPNQSGQKYHRGDHQQQPRAHQ